MIMSGTHAWGRQENSCGKATTATLVWKPQNHYLCGNFLDYFLSYFVCSVEILTACRTSCVLPETIDGKHGVFVQFRFV